MYPDLLRERPLVFWGLIFAAFGVALMLMPGEVADDWRDPLDRKQLGPFSKRVERVDFALRDGERIDLSRKTFRRMRPMLQARRMSTKGGMSEEEVLRAVELLRRRNRQVRREDSAGSKRAMRQLWNRRLGEEFPKLETRDVRSALRGLDEEVDRLIDVGASDGSDPVNVAGTGVDTGEPDASIHGNADAGTSAGRETRRGAARSREDDP